MNEIPYKIQLDIFYDAKKLELSSFNVILAIRDQSGSDIYGHISFNCFTVVLYNFHCLGCPHTIANAFNISKICHPCYAEILKNTW